jgi:hypothetical protein
LDIVVSTKAYARMRLQEIKAEVDLEQDSHWHRWAMTLAISKTESAGITTEQCGMVS